MEMFGEGNDEQISFDSVEIEESQFSFIVTQHSLHMLVVEIVANVINQIRIVHFDGNCHEHNDFKIQHVFSSRT